MLNLNVTPDECGLWKKKKDLNVLLWAVFQVCSCKHVQAAAAAAARGGWGGAAAQLHSISGWTWGLPAACPAAQAQINRGTLQPRVIWQCSQVLKKTPPRKKPAATQTQSRVDQLTTRNPVSMETASAAPRGLAAGLLWMGWRHGAGARESVRKEGETEGERQRLRWFAPGSAPTCSCANSSPACQASVIPSVRGDAQIGRSCGCEGVKGRKWKNTIAPDVDTDRRSWGAFSHMRKGAQKAQETGGCRRDRPWLWLLLLLLRVKAAALTELNRTEGMTP